MKLLKSGLLIFLIMACSLGCVRMGIDSRIEKAFDDLILRFPQLPKGERKLTDFYTQVRTVEFHQFQIQLWSTPEQIADKQRVVVFVNPAGCCYAVPLLSNRIYLLHQVWGHQRKQFSIKVYRQDCEVHLIDI